MTAFDKILGALRANRAQVQVISSESVRTTCPCHADRRPSLGLTRREGRALVHCFAGCKTSVVLQALGLRMADLFDGDCPRRVPSQIVGHYDYFDRDGAFLAQKVRLLPKAFRWRRRDPTGTHVWRWGLDGIRVGLYRLPELLGRLLVFATEGEKSADLLSRLGAAATCPHAGVNSWPLDYSEELYRAGCRELVILADNDAPGRKHAQQVAATTFGVGDGEPIFIKVVILAGLPSGGDVYDWLTAGRSLDDLMAVVEATPIWSPGSDARRNADNRRAKTRERVRRYRAGLRRGMVTVSPSATERPHAIAAALEAILSVLTSVEDARSGRQLKAALRGIHPANTIDKALKSGCNLGALRVEAGIRRALLYRPAHAVDRPGSSDPIDILSVTPARHSMSVPATATQHLRESNQFAQRNVVFECLETLYAVTLCERSSGTLQDKVEEKDPVGVSTGYQGGDIRDTCTNLSGSGGDAMFPPAGFCTCSVENGPCGYCDGPDRGHDSVVPLASLARASQ